MMWRTTIGDVDVFRVGELLQPGQTPAAQFRGFDASVYDEAPELLDPNFLDPATGRSMSSIHSWLFRLGRETVLVDTGAGNEKIRIPPANPRFHLLHTRWLDTLASYGVSPEDVTVVINTHLHVDHVGWNTRLSDGRWVPTFPKARYLMGKVELEHWRDPEGGGKFHPGNLPAIADSVDPVVEAGRVELFEDGDEILPGVTVRAAPGHTKGQVMLELRSGGETAIFSADVFHQPLQVARPELDTVYTEQPAMAVATRRKLLEAAADSGACLFPAHTGYPHAGHIARRGGGFRFVPLSLSDGASP